MLGLFGDHLSTRRAEQKIIYAYSAVKALVFGIERARLQCQTWRRLGHELRVRPAFCAAHVGKANTRFMRAARQCAAKLQNIRQQFGVIDANFARGMSFLMINSIRRAETTTTPIPYFSVYFLD